MSPTQAQKATPIVWATEVGRDDVPIVGGKGANIGEMLQVGLPVPEAFIVTAAAFRRFVSDAGIGPAMAEALKDLDVEDNKRLTDAATAIQALIRAKAIPPALEADLRKAYESLVDGQDAPVAVRSSATAEDLPEASFAGQQDTYLYVAGADAVVEHVRRCWASLYTPRAVYYRAKTGFPHDQVAMAVVVQRMVAADTSGVLFTRHPTSGEERRIVEAAWGLGEGVVSGQVTPDHYELSPEGEVLVEQTATKKTMIVRRPDGQGTVAAEVPKDKRDSRVLSDAQLAALTRLARTLERHYGAAQDVEWAFEDQELYVLQTRPITTIRDATKSTKAVAGDASAAETLLKGLAASPGIGAGKCVHVLSGDELDRCREGDILVTTMTTPDMVPAMRRAAAIVTDEGGMTCHAAIVSRELGIPCVVGTKKGTTVLTEGLEVTVDGDRGSVVGGLATASRAAAKAAADSAREGAAAPAGRSGKPVTATEVKVNISMPEATERALAVDPDGVGLLRIEHIILGLPKHPLSYLTEGRESEYVKFLVERIGRVANAFYPRPVWVRTLDAPTDEFRRMKGGEDEPHEPNPMLGFRGIRRSLVQPELLKAELRAIKQLRDKGATNVGVMLPLIQHPREVREAKAIAREVGLRPGEDPTLKFGIMVEVPAAALIIEDILAEGIDFVSFGTNDLTQYTLAVDRNNENVAPLYDEFHPAIAKLIKMVIFECRKHGVETSICGQAGSNPRFVAKLIEWGISSVSANIDAVERVRETVARVERRLLLESARGRAP